MFNLSKSLSSQVLAPAARRLVCSARYKSTQQEDEEDMLDFSMSPKPVYTDETVAPYPKTQEERLRAARKYNLIPEDYEPYPEDEGWGDYPKLPAIGDFNKDKYNDYDDPDSLRYYGEPFHRDADLYQWHKIDPLEHLKPHYMPLWKKFLIFAAAGLWVPVVYKIFDHYRLNINHPYKISGFEDKPRYSFPDAPDPFAHSHH